MAAGVSAVGVAKQSEQLELKKPDPFDAPLNRADYVDVSEEDFNFVLGCQAILVQQRLGPRTVQGFDRQRIQKMRELRTSWGLPTASVSQHTLRLHLHAMLESLRDPLLVFQAGYFDQETRKFIAPSTHPDAAVPEFIQRPLLAWYSAVAMNCQIREDRYYNSAQIQHLKNCMLWVKSPRHAVGILAMILATKDFTPKDYIAPKLLLDLQERFPDLPHLDLLPAAVALRRHDYTLANVVNKEFFKGVESSLLTEAERGVRKSLVKEARISAEESFLGQAVQHVLQWSSFGLLKLTAHLVTLAHPKFEISFPELAEYDNYLLNRYCTRRLIEKGFLNSEGMMIEQEVSIIKEGKKRCSKKFALAYAEILESYGIPLTKKGEELARLLHAAVTVDYPLIMEKKKRLDGLSRVDAIASLYVLMGQNPESEPVLANFRDVTRTCFEISARVNALRPKKQDGEPEAQKKVTPEEAKKNKKLQEKQCFNLAKEVVKKLKAKPQTIILQGRFPDGERRHAFYVAIRHKDDGSGEIILVNGGGLASHFHEQDERLMPSEVKDARFGNYHPVSIPLPKMTELDWQFLNHYVFCILSLHLDNLGDSKEEESARLNRIIGNLYLCRHGVAPGTFLGCDGYRVDRYRSEVHPRVYRAQLAGNCTVYNYKQTVKIGFGLNEIQYGLFEDGLIRSMDGLISQCLSSVKPSHAGAESKTEEMPDSKNSTPFAATMTSLNGSFAQILAERLKVQVKLISPNGHCQFRAIAAELKRNGKFGNYSEVALTQKVREKAVDCLRSKDGRTQAEPFFNAAECNGCSTYDAYVAQMAAAQDPTAMTTAYGNQMTLVALANALSLPIIILHPNDFAPGAKPPIAHRVLGSPDLSTLDFSKAIYLVFNGVNHYDTIQGVSTELVAYWKSHLPVSESEPSLGV